MIRRLRLLAVTMLALAATAVTAHELRPGFFELREVGAATYSFLWKQPITGEAGSSDVVPVLAERCKVSSGDGERDLLAPVARGTIACEGGLGGATIAFAGLEATVTDVIVRVHHADGRLESHLLRPTATTVVLGARTSGLARATSYLRLGIQHIVLGVDHLLFVLGLLFIVGARASDRWMLAKTITAFTVAHSITLAVATLGYAVVPLPPLNAAIALSILFLAPEIVRARRGETSFTIRHPWVVAFAFGLLHGFGFATGLTAIGLPPAEIPLALLLFNVGVELGQLALVALALLLARSFRVLEIRWPRWVEALPAYSVGALGALWTIQRTLALIAGTA